MMNRSMPLAVFSNAKMDVSSASDKVKIVSVLFSAVRAMSKHTVNAVKTGMETELATLTTLLLLFGIVTFWFLSATATARVKNIRS